jgi:dynein heavy chain, axonemal
MVFFKFKTSFWFFLSSLLLLLLSRNFKHTYTYTHVPFHTQPNTHTHKVADIEFVPGADLIGLIPTCGIFITMNPTYAGRTELPENLKVLFRSCSMVRPDLKPICENMLMGEGFVKAPVLADKFVTLYALCNELLSKQPHYDWGLRAIKSVLKVAGKLKRSEPEVDEEPILMRALRDFNIPKIPIEGDLPIFMRLIGDIFMGRELKSVVNSVSRTHSCF